MKKPRATGDGPTTNIPLLKNTQAYLESLLKRQVPDTILTESWDQFYRIYSELIRRFAFSRGMRGSDVEDCIQEVWKEVATRLVGFRHPGNRPGLRAWLYTIVRSKAADLVRQRARHPSKSPSEVVDPETLRSREADPHEALEREWERALLHTVLEELRRQVSDVNYQVIRLRLIEGRGVSEVAAVLQLKATQVRARQHRTLKKLRAAMALFTGDTFRDR